jgi:hypothetical protein
VTLSHIMFFRTSDVKRAERLAAQTEIDRLKSLTPQRLATEVLPTLNSDALKGQSGGARVQAICKELLDGLGSPFSVNPGVLLLPVREALQRLEHANLVIQTSSGIDSASRWRITPTGVQAITNGDTAIRLSPTST